MLKDLHMAVAQAKVQLMHAAEVMDRLQADGAGSVSIEAMERMVMPPLEAALNSAVRGADKCRSAL